MNDPTDSVCPACRSRRVVLGEIRPVNSWYYPMRFRPHGLRVFRLSLTRKMLPLTAGSAACLDCGLAWSRVDPKALEETLSDWGEDYLKERLGLSDPKDVKSRRDDLA